MSAKHEMFVERLKLCMALGSVNQSELCAKAGISPGTVNEWAKRTRLPRLDQAERAAAALGVNPGWLAFGDGDPA